MKLVNLIPLQEIDFASQKGFDAYNKAHKLRPDTKVTIAGKTTTAGQAAKVKGTSVFDKDKEQKKSFKDLGIDRDSAVNAHLDAKKAAKGEEPAKIDSNFSMDVVKMLRKANISDVDDNTTKLLSKLQKVKGETVADTKTGKISYFLYDGSRYEMNIDVKNKSIRTKELKSTGGGNDKSITDIKMDKQVDVSMVSKSILSNLKVKDGIGVVNKDADELQKRLNKGQNGIYTRTSPHGGVITFKDGAKFDTFRPYDTHKTKSTIIYTSKK
jgi:hypothetical protein